MKHFSILNRGYSSYRVHTRKDRDTVALRTEIKQSNIKNDSLISTKLNIKIEDDWIIEIEEGLRHVTSAVMQERQFIATTGEVVPIEKVKKVSKASIVHLAKHSDLISRLPEEGEILTPDKVYMEEKVSDFAVYENRFLYTLIIYLQQFVSMRLDKINETIRTYKSNLVINKDIVSKNYKLSFELSFKEERYDILNSLVDDETKALIERMDMISRELISLLATPLMKAVSKAPLVTTPLVKTNVLKNNKDFKAAVLLFDYINNCDKDGYLIDEINESFSPFSSELADDYAEVIGLTSFVSYKHGNKQQEVFVKEMVDYEDAVKAKAKSDLLDRIDKIKNKLMQRDMTVEEYVLILEKRNNELEEENANVVILQEEVKKLEQDKFELNNTINELEDYISRLKEEKVDLNNQLTVANQNCEEAISAKEEAILECEEKISSLRETITSELEEDFNNTKATLIEEYAEKERETTSSFENLERDLRNDIDTKEKEMNDILSESKDELQEALKDARKANEDKSFALAQLLALRLKMNLTTAEDDYTSKERFKELEEQYFVFEKFFGDEWKRTKKQLRKQYLSNKK